MDRAPHQRKKKGSPAVKPPDQIPNVPLAKDALALALLPEETHKTVIESLDYAGEVAPEVWRAVPSDIPPPGQVWEPLMHYDPHASAWLVSVARPTAPPLTWEDLVDAAPAEDYSLVVPSLIPPPPRRVSEARTALRAQAGVIPPGADVALAGALAFAEQASVAVHGEIPSVAPDLPVTEAAAAESEAEPVPAEVRAELEDHYESVRGLEEFTEWAIAAAPHIAYPSTLPPPGDPSIDEGDTLTSAITRARAQARYALAREAAIPDRPPPPPPGPDVREAIREHFRRGDDVLMPQTEVWLIAALEAADAGWPAVPLPRVRPRPLPELRPQPLTAPGPEPMLPFIAYPSRRVEPPGPDARAMIEEYHAGLGVDEEAADVGAAFGEPLPLTAPAVLRPPPEIPEPMLSAPRADLGLPRPSVEERIGYLMEQLAETPAAEPMEPVLRWAAEVAAEVDDAVTAPVPGAAALAAPTPPARALPELAAETMGRPAGAAGLPPTRASLIIPTEPPEEPPYLKALESPAFTAPPPPAVIDVPVTPPVSSVLAWANQAAAEFYAEDGTPMPPGGEWPPQPVAPLPPAGRRRLRRIARWKQMYEARPLPEPPPVELLDSIGELLRADDVLPAGTEHEVSNVLEMANDARAALLEMDLPELPVLPPLRKPTADDLQVARRLIDSAQALGSLTGQTADVLRTTLRYEGLHWAPPPPTPSEVRAAMDVIESDPAAVPPEQADPVSAAMAFALDAANDYWTERAAVRDDRVLVDSVESEAQPPERMKWSEVVAVLSQTRRRLVARAAVAFRRRLAPDISEPDARDAIHGYLSSLGVDTDVDEVQAILDEAAPLPVPEVERTLPPAPPDRRPPVPSGLSVPPPAHQPYIPTPELPAPAVPSLPPAPETPEYPAPAMPSLPPPEPPRLPYVPAPDLPAPPAPTLPPAPETPEYPAPAMPSLPPPEPPRLPYVPAPDLPAPPAPTLPPAPETPELPAPPSPTLPPPVTIDEAFEPVPIEANLVATRAELRERFNEAAAEHERLRERVAQVWRRRRVREADAARATELKQAMGGMLSELNEIEQQLTAMGSRSAMTATTDMPQGEEVVDWLNAVADRITPRETLADIAAGMTDVAGYDQRNTNLHPQVYAEGCLMMDTVWMGVMLGRAVGNEGVAQVQDADDMNRLYEIFMEAGWVEENTLVNLHPMLVLYAAGSIDEKGNPIEGRTQVIADKLDTALWWDEPQALKEYENPLEGYTYTWHWRAPGRQHWTTSVLDQRYDPLHGSSQAVTSGKIVGYRRFALTRETQRALERLNNE